MDEQSLIFSSSLVFVVFSLCFGFVALFFFSDLDLEISHGKTLLITGTTGDKNL